MMDFDSFRSVNVLFERVPELLILFSLYHIVVILFTFPSQESIEIEPIELIVSKN